MRGSDRCCLGPTLMRSRNSEEGEEGVRKEGRQQGRGGKEEEGGGAKIGKCRREKSVQSVRSKIREEMIGEGEDWWGGRHVRVESVDEQTIFVSVTDIMANYSNSGLMKVWHAAR